MLRLLEQHHKQLAHILKEPHLKVPTNTADKRDDDPVSGKSNDAVQSTLQPPRLVKAGRSTARNLSSSIASDLASARGIPGARQKRSIPVSPLISNEHADATLSQQKREQISGNLETNGKSSLPSWAPPQALSKPVGSTATSNSPFQQFYNRFEGVISTLTAPLAFASLPLAQSSDEAKHELQRAPSPESPRKVPSKASTSSVMADYSQLISDAALRAVRDNNEPGYPKPHESFLLVPTSGGTISYADITAANYVDRQVNRQRHRRDLSNTSDDFVDASSQILPQPPIPSLLAAQQSGNTADIEKWAGMVKYQGKTLEELHLENQILRQNSNELAKRLFVFESAAQEARLAQSIRGMQLSPITTPENSRGKMISVSGGHSTDGGLRMAQARIQELEDALRKNDRRLVKREEENAKLKDTLGKYREKWEGLKAGAKARREQAGGGDKLRRGSSATSTATTVASAAKDKDKERDASDAVETK